MAREDRQILDADGHIIEWDQELYEYLQPPYRGNTALLGYPFFPSLDGYQRGAILARTGIHKSYAINADTWINFLDEVGIATTVLYPTAGLGFGIIQDPDWAVALARAYNDWFTDRYYRVNQRLRAVALVPLQDVSEAVREARRAVNELGMVGLVLPANGGDLGLRKPLGHPDFWPLYEEAERLNCPIAIHGAPSQGIGLDAFTRFAKTQALEHPIAQMIQMTDMIYEGVFERFPRLRVAYLEAGTGWVPYMMDRLDRSYGAWATSQHKEYGDWVKRKPSEYIAGGNIYFSCEGGEESLKYAIERIGDRVLLYASDFPHEVNVERAQHEIAELRERDDLSAETKRNILHDNVRRFYQR
jgi:predicted TIM-barrel fold metal-dependent hydrolase